ncbi:MAG: hypothetical protein ACW99A_23955, partial [Candidatus Kariarchaeaceae archaeon]
SLQLPDTFQSYIAGFIEKLPYNTITLFEGDKKSVRKFHEEIHQLMVKAIQEGFEVRLIDIANCFNPQLISTLCLEDAENPHIILKQIKLARPFQMFQSASIIKQLAKILAKDPPKRPQLIIITCISSQFFDAAASNEDPNFPVPQLELFRHTLGVVQSLASQGYTIIATELLESNPGLDISNNKNEKVELRVQNNSLSHVSKVHIRVSEMGNSRRVELMNHPTLAPQASNITLDKDISALDGAQTSLNDWF